MLLFQDVAALLEGGLVRQNITKDLRRLGLELEVVAAAEGSPSIGTSIADIEIAAGGAFLVVALTRDGESQLQPQPHVTIQAGDGLAVVGRPVRARAIEQLFMTPKASVT
jgi:K+/H+ antiporter YhaU regulatory subunit KhtT